MVNYGINYTLAQVGATSQSGPYPALVGATSKSSNQEIKKSRNQEINGMNAI